ncbi:MAG TPA: hypothetical protein VK968_06590, partial [Roseimicrobium sp.]|nr:hypothetical protein [Roseimicrobium sp.]
ADYYFDKQGRGIVSWLAADRLDLPDPRYPKYVPEIYDVDGAPYESLLIGQFAVMRNRDPKINEICLGFSRDGFHWHRPSRTAFVGLLEKDGKLYENNQPAAGGCLVMGDQLYFYGMRTGAQWEYAGTGLSTLRRDGFASMDATEAGGTLTTRPVTFKGGHLFVNLDAPAGELRVEVLDAAGAVLDAFSRDHCRPLRGDRTRLPVKWDGAGDLLPYAGQPIRFRFHLKSGKLYSFWVSSETSGASHGYVAAGGPTLTGSTDTVGQPAQ